MKHVQEWCSWIWSPGFCSHVQSCAQEESSSPSLFVRTGSTDASASHRRSVGLPWKAKYWYFILKTGIGIGWQLSLIGVTTGFSLVNHVSIQHGMIPGMGSCYSAWDVRSGKRRSYVVADTDLGCDQRRREADLEPPSRAPLPTWAIGTGLMGLK